MNAMAGGGSFISFPAMLSMGVAPVQANATNTVALWPGQLTSVAALREDLRRDLLPSVCAASILGGVSGAVLLLHTRQITFLHMVPWLLLVASLLFGISGPVSRWLRRRSEAPHIQKPLAVIPLFFVLLPVCFYIGYFGAGAGFWRRGDAGAELNESAGGLPVQPLRRSDVRVQRSGDLALLPDLDGVCCSWRLCWGAVCSKDKCGCLANNRRNYRMRDGRLLLLEEWLMEL